MTGFLLKEIINENVLQELSAIGFDESYRVVAQNKFKYKNIKIFDLTCAQANILKQTALIFGADCAVNKNVITGNIEKSDVILCGSYSQLLKIAKKLSTQPLKLALLGQSIENLLLSTKKAKTKLVGILNITPNSFSDGGLYNTPSKAYQHLLELIEDGADIIDIGAESTKPYSEAVSFREQIERLKPIFEYINRDKITIPISVDTRCSKVADFALNNGARIINDVSGLEYDENMAKVVFSYSADIILQHSLGTPLNMQDNPKYNNLIEDIYFGLKRKIESAKSFGIKNIIVDPGIGFGKTKEHNFEILNRIEEFYSLNYPIMVGISRKSFLGVKEDDNSLKDTLSVALAYPLVQKNVDYLRVHNVKLHKKLIEM